MDADLRRVIAANRRLLGHHEKFFERALRRDLVAADVVEDDVGLSGSELDERRPEAGRRLGVERRHAADPPQRLLRLRLAEQKVDVVGDPRLLRAR